MWVLDVGSIRIYCMWGGSYGLTEVEDVVDRGRWRMMLWEVLICLGR